MHSYPIVPDRPGDDPIFALNHEATARAVSGEDIVNATIGVLLHDDGSLAVLPTAARAVADLGTGQWAPYAPISGDPEFLKSVTVDLIGARPTLARYVAAVATPGGTGAVRHAIACFLDEGHALLTTSFYWSPYAIIADEHKRRVATFEMFDAASGQFGVAAFDRELGSLMASQGRALIVLNDPCHNPTGYSMTRADWQGVAQSLTAHAPRGPITVLIDAAYSAYAKQGLALATEALEPIADRVLLMFAWSASKTFTHYGLRVGALVATPADETVRKQIQATLGYASRATWSNCNRGGMAAMTSLLSDPERAMQVRRERADAARTLGARVEAFNRAAKAVGLPYPRYDGGFFVSVFAKDARAVAEKMKTRGVFAVPLRGAVRVALCAVAERKVARVVEALAAALA